MTKTSHAVVFFFLWNQSVKAFFFSFLYSKEFPSEARRGFFFLWNTKDPHKIPTALRWWVGLQRRRSSGSGRLFTTENSQIRPEADVKRVHRRTREREPRRTRCRNVTEACRTLLYNWGVPKPNHSHCWAESLQSRDKDAHFSSNTTQTVAYVWVTRAHWNPMTQHHHLGLSVGQTELWVTAEVHCSDSFNI